MGSKAQVVNAKSSFSGGQPTLAQRAVVALGIVIAAIIVYAVIAFAGLLPRPADLGTLANSKNVGRGPVLVSGFFVTQPFVSYGGVTLPPYAFAATAAKDAPSVRITPTLRDLHAGRIVAVIDTATGDGTAGSPYVIHTIGVYNVFVDGVIVAGLILILLAFLIAGPLWSALANKQRAPAG